MTSLRGPTAGFPPGVSSSEGQPKPLRYASHCQWRVELTFSTNGVLAVELGLPHLRRIKS
jgi:hypothetical protein